MALYKRLGSKYYWMKFTFDGSLVQQSTKCSNKAAAQTVESAYRHELALGRIGIKIKKNAPTFEQAVKDFLEWSKTEHGERSQQRYRFFCQPLKKFFGKTKVDNIEVLDVEKFAVWRKNQISRKTGELITGETVNHELVILKKIFAASATVKIYGKTRRG